MSTSSNDVENIGNEIEDAEDVPLTGRIAARPRPATVWLVGVLLLVAVEFGALLGLIFELLLTIAGLLPGDPAAGLLAGAASVAAEIPTLLSRETIPNGGYFDGRAWVNTFLGLEPMYAWALRVVLVYAYTFVWLAWLWKGYQWFRAHYRQVDWTPRDDMVGRLQGHRWGQFGLIVVIGFLVFALFAPALSPVTAQDNIYSPYGNQFQYYSETTDSVAQTSAGVANLQSTSKGIPGQNVGPLSYDDFGRFHPFGTLTTGKDLFTYMAYGARISLLIGLSTMLGAGAIALVLAMVTAYYKGLADLATVLASDSVQSLPFLLMAILATVIFQGTWLDSTYGGAPLLIVVFTFFYWPFLWRAVRGPAFQIAEQEWIDAAKSYGQKPSVIMRKHMIPYVVSYMLIYASLSLGGVIIAVAALSFLGLGISPPTPEWGRIIAAGQPYVASPSWHISLIPGIMITLVVTGFNAFGDGIRDAIDPQSGGSEDGAAAAAAGGGGG
jgi:peptide/nickel transport system permease protein